MWSITDLLILLTLTNGIYWIPVDGLSISSFVSTNTGGAATLATNGSAYAVGYYDNSVDHGQIIQLEP